MMQADWEMMYEDQADTLRGYLRALFKGTPDEQPEAHKKSSPITYVDDMAAPLCALRDCFLEPCCASSCA